MTWLRSSFGIYTSICGAFHREFRRLDVVHTAYCSSVIVVVVILVLMVVIVAFFVVGVFFRAVLDGVTRNPEWVVGGGRHTECSDVLFIVVVECAHVVWNIEAELVVVVIEYVVESHGAFGKVVWD